MMVALLQVSGSSAIRRGTATRTIKKRSASSQANTTLAPRHRAASRSVKGGAAAVRSPLLSRQSKVGREALKIPSLRGTLSVIISVRNEEQTLARLLHQVSRLGPAEIIVVLNGCSDNSFPISRQHRQAVVVHCPESVGHDVGRAIGAKLSRGDILLFLDGDMVIPASQLGLFTAAVDGGIDVALNDLDPLMPSFGLCDDVTRSKLFLNYALGRYDLGVSSMTAVPHALSRRALEIIGYRELIVPPKAQARSVLEKLRVEKAGTVNVIKHNRLRHANIGAGNAVEKLIIGDHAEALLVVLSRRDEWGPLNSEIQRKYRRQVAAWRNRI
ncbi:glycosyltransferase [Paenibacillus sp.]|uniref:glycosyltransferase family 2 protein n=1 Tax=Paenibacillus sp. TaxID=58172 RepID=UPI0028AA1AB2|nr:glycosyltransferase [Paenibacillus sp.]